MKALYPDIEPYACHRVQRGHHQLYVEECGRPEGLPVLFLHGGPGSGCKPYQRSFFDPARYRIVLVDQRGAGRSTPHGHLEANTTALLLEDLEFIRHLLKIPRWLLFGGSWGATLALLYAQQYPGRASGLVLRGSFLGRQSDLDWFAGADGIRRVYPDRWAECVDFLPESERDEPLSAFYRRLRGDDELAQRRAARHWALWSEQVLLGESFRPEAFSEHVSAHQVNQARIELHYAVHGYFLAGRSILDQCADIAHLPAILIHGRRDWVCPVESSYSLHRRLTQSSLCLLPESGHIAAGDAMIDALVTAADAMAERLAP